MFASTLNFIFPVLDYDHFISTLRMPLKVNPNNDTLNGLLQSGHGQYCETNYDL